MRAGQARRIDVDLRLKLLRNFIPIRSRTDVKKPPEGGLSISRSGAREERAAGNYLLAAEAAIIAAFAAPMAADEAASLAAEAAAIEAEADVSADEAAIAEDVAADEAASAAGAVVVSAGLLQAARAAAATREANRSDFFMNFLEENLGSNHYR
jgi:hypothetical protein